VRAGTTVDELTPKRMRSRNCLQRWLRPASNTLILRKSDEEIESALIASVNELMSAGPTGSSSA